MGRVMIFLGYLWPGYRSDLPKGNFGSMGDGKDQPSHSRSSSGHIQQGLDGSIHSLKNLMGLG